jgi:hypothetical protein
VPLAIQLAGNPVDAPNSGAPVSFSLTTSAKTDSHRRFRITLFAPSSPAAWQTSDTHVRATSGAAPPTALGIGS